MADDQKGNSKGESETRHPYQSLLLQAPPSSSTTNILGNFDIHHCSYVLAVEVQLAVDKPSYLVLGPGLHGSI